MDTDKKERRTKNRQEDSGTGRFLQTNERKSRTEKSGAENDG
jgi:hypothetical protein